MALCVCLAASSGCSGSKSPVVATPAEKHRKNAFKAPYAGTVNVPQRRAVRGDEMTPPIAQRAREILDEQRDVAFGTEVPFEVDGQSYIGRIEEHYHELGGPRRPWGRHRGVTVCHAE
jgi:hypothetical protein